MNLAAQQRAFLAAIVDEDAPLPANWPAKARAGMAVYRNNYQSQLLSAMAETYARTVQWVGETAFARAAAHHVITRPPSGWSVDHIGAGFDKTVGHLFANDGEVAELVWTEWAMQCAFVSGDTPPMTAADFAAATQGFSDDDWEGVRLRFHPSLAIRGVTHNLAAIWNRLGGKALADNSAPPMTAKGYCVVHREGLRAAFYMADANEGESLSRALNDATFGTLCTQLASQTNIERAAKIAGGLLGKWIGLGLIIGLA